MIEVTLLGLAFVAALAALGWLFIRQLRVVLPTIPQSKPPETPSVESLDALRQSVQGLEERTLSMFERLTQAVADGIDHVDRNESRVRGIVTGAKNRFASSGYEDPGVDAEYRTLPEADDGGGGEEELQLVPEGVGGGGGRRRGT